MKRHDIVPDSATVLELFSEAGGPVHGAPFVPANDLDLRAAATAGADVASRVLPGQSGAPLRIGLIDSVRFRQECLVKAFEGMSPRLGIRPFETVEEFEASPNGFQLVIYYIPGDGAWDASAERDLAHLVKTLGATPLIVMSDADHAQQSAALRGTLKCGARGFVPTRTTGLPITLAIIRFVQAGGMFAPLDLLLGDAPEQRPAPAPEPAARGRFTSRQSDVLALLQQGKANKIIAHELGMSESTVKVHVRNIMRMTGATNRTQAAYKVRAFTARGDVLACAS